MSKENSTPKKKADKRDEKIAELTADLQRQRADFENYRKNVDSQVSSARQIGEILMIKKLLPVIDNINRATANIPAELAENAWANGVVSLNKNLEKVLGDIDIKKIIAEPGTPFNPEYHHAVAFEEGDGGEEIIAEELQPGYKLGDTVLREAMVKVKQ